MRSRTAGMTAGSVAWNAANWMSASLRGSVFPPMIARRPRALWDRPIGRRNSVTLLWFSVWAISNAVGDNEPLLTDPVNVWMWTLILAIALDLGRQHTAIRKKKEN